MASKRGTVPLKLSETKWKIPPEIVLDGFGKDDPPVRNKLPVEVGHTRVFVHERTRKGVNIS